MNLFQHYMGGFPRFEYAEQGQRIQPHSFGQFNAGGHVQQGPSFGTGNAGKGLMGIYSQPPGQMTNLAPPGGYGQQMHAGGELQPQQMGNQGFGGLAGMFRGFSPYGRQYMR